MLQWLFGKKKEQKKQDKKPKKQKKEQQAQDKWMYDFVLQFLNSPIWRVSILEFVDNNCIVFDTQEQNKFQYTVIHNKFKQLVGSLFDGMMSQVGLSEDKLIQLLEIGFQSKQRKLFNQLLLCDDFMKFKQLMVKRNKSLQEQALRAMKGQPPKKVYSYQKEKAQLLKTQQSSSQRKRQLQQQEEQVLRKVLEMSKLEAQEQASIQKLQWKAQQYQNNHHQVKEQPKFVAKQQQQNHNDDEEQQRRRQVQEKKQRIRAKMRKQKLNPIQQSHKSVLPPVKARHHINQQDLSWKNPIAKEQNNYPSFNQQVKFQPPQQQIKFQPPKQQIFQKPIQQQVQSLQDRKRRLLQQRQRIRKKKQQQRKKMLEQQSKATMNIVLQDDGIHESNVGIKHNQQSEDNKVSNAEIERRKQLMKKIKNRIVDDF